MSDPILAPIAIAGAIKPPAQPEAKLTIVLIARASTCITEKDISGLVSITLVVKTPPPKEYIPLYQLILAMIGIKCHHFDLIAAIFLNK